MGIQKSDEEKNQGRHRRNVFALIHGKSEIEKNDDFDLEVSSIGCRLVIDVADRSGCGTSQTNFYRDRSCKVLESGVSCCRISGISGISGRTFPSCHVSGVGSGSCSRPGGGTIILESAF